MFANTLLAVKWKQFVYDRAMKNRIAEQRALRKISQRELGRLAGTTGQMIGMLERGERKLDIDWLRRIATALGCEPVDLIPQEMAGEGTPNSGRQSLPEVETPLPPSNVTPGPDVVVPTHLEMPLNLPVRGTAACSSGDGAFQIETEGVVDWVRRPPILRGISDAYALYLSGDSMEPKWSSGDLVLVHPKRPVRPGDHVILILQDGPHETPYAYCKRLIRRHNGVVTVEQYNPRGTRDFQELNILGIHRVLEMADLF